MISHTFIFYQENHMESQHEVTENTVQDDEPLRLDGTQYATFNLNLTEHKSKMCCFSLETGKPKLEIWRKMWLD